MQANRKTIWELSGQLGQMAKDLQRAVKRFSETQTGSEQAKTRVAHTCNAAYQTIKHIMDHVEAIEADPPQPGEVPIEQTKETPQEVTRGL